MAQFQREDFADIYEEVKPLLQRHWAEISSNLDIPLDVNVEVYEAAESIDAFRAYTAREDGVIVGYAAMFLHQGVHYKQCKQATQDVIYIDPDYRGRTLGIRLLSYVDDQLKAEGVQLVHQHVKLAHPALGRLLERMGYKAVERIYQRRLD